MICRGIRSASNNGLDVSTAMDKKYDVVVVNFVDTNNTIDQRIYEILDKNLDYLMVYLVHRMKFSEV